MFRLDKLEINGFKSFHDPADLTFPAAMTAVVGPNGCGKSNICDAIIWVLGENRASHIRGETMDDVIFQGSARRRALSMGEVTLTLRTTNGHPVSDDGLITLHRRVFRTGESEFRLNGRRVRLRELSDELSTAKRSLYKARIVAAEAEQRIAREGVEEAQRGESAHAMQASSEESSLSENRSLLAARSARASSVREEIASLTGEVE